jgi:hypothetical protein
MGCSCGKKGTAPGQISVSDFKEPCVWGPAYWRILHTMAERVGAMNNPLLDTDRARTMETLVRTLALVLPCAECQAHFKNEAPAIAWVGLYGPVLTFAVSQWLFNFHNAVRQRLGQPIMLDTSEACSALYGTTTITDKDVQIIEAAASYAIANNIVKQPVWKKWFSTFKLLRVMLGV